MELAVDHLPQEGAELEVSALHGFAHLQEVVVEGVGIGRGRGGRTVGTDGCSAKPGQRTGGSLGGVHILAPADPSKSFAGADPLLEGGLGGLPVGTR